MKWEKLSKRKVLIDVSSHFSCGSFWYKPKPSNLPQAFLKFESILIRPKIISRLKKKSLDCFNGSQDYPETNSKKSPGKINDCKMNLFFWSPAYFLSLSWFSGRAP